MKTVWENLRSIFKILLFLAKFCGNFKKFREKFKKNSPKMKRNFCRTFMMKLIKILWDIENILSKFWENIGDFKEFLGKYL